MLFPREFWGNAGSRWQRVMQDAGLFLSLPQLSLCAVGRRGLRSQRTLKGPVAAQPVSVGESLCLSLADTLVRIGSAFTAPQSLLAGSTQNSPLVLIGLD